MFKHIEREPHNPDAKVTVKRGLFSGAFAKWKDRLECAKQQKAAEVTNPLHAQSPLIEEKSRISDAKVARVDKSAIISYYVIVGAAIDIITGLKLNGIIFARSLSVAANSTVLGKLYGKWREQVYRAFGTTEKSGKIKKYFTELIAYIPFRTPVYTASNMLGSLIQEGRINLEKALVGTLIFVAYSPLAAPILGAYMDALRKAFGINPAAVGAYGKAAETQPQFAIERKPIGARIREAFARFGERVDGALGSRAVERLGHAFQIAILVVYSSAILSAMGRFAFSNDPKGKETISAFEQATRTPSDNKNGPADRDIVSFMNAS
jgi:hypothetical protein